MEEKINIEEIIKKETENLWKKAFNEGLMAGWFAACVSMYNESKDLHNAKDYRRFLCKKMEDAKIRISTSADESDHTEA